MNRRPALAVAARGCAAALWLALAGCGSAPASPPGTESPPPAAEAVPASPERRAQLHLELAAGYFARGRFQTALDELDAVLAARPDMHEAYGLRGLVYAALGEYPQAEESFRRALQLSPGNPETMHNFGWFLCQVRRFDDAEAQFQAALAQPSYREPQRTLLAEGVCFARAGRMADAERVLSRAYELDPANAAAGFNLSEVLFRRGEFDRARFYLDRVNAVPEFVNAQTLWLAARIEQRAGNAIAARDYGRRLRERYPQSPEALLYEQGRFGDD